MESRSGTSSPDPLGPPGDAEYLISSPLKPLPDYRHVTSSPKRTPPIQTRNKTNNRSSQPVRLQDVVMSATPTPGKSGNRLSPSKSTMHSENNLSPWRIRVTVEAEHEDDINNGGIAPMKPLSGAKSPKMPLKKENNSPSPKKKRGRPRKSDAPQGNLTPSKANRNTPKAKGDSGRKRKRETPRKKALPDSDIAQSIEGRDGSEKSTGDSLFDIGVDQNVNTDFVTQSPVYDDFDDGNPHGYISSNNSSPRASKKRLLNIPNLPPGDLGNDLDENTRLTPIKQSSSDRKRAEVSPENTMHAGHTPGPRSRFYPTPTTSSSLLEDEHQAKTVDASIDDVMHVEETDEVDGITHGHREYDTIMESEGFSMVSLDTLPSAKQHADSTAKNKSQASNLGTKRAIPPVSAPPHINQLMEVSSTRPSPRSQPFQNINKGHSPSKITPAINNNLSPKQPPPAQAVQPPAPATKKSIPSLARVVRSGIALQGVLDRRGKNGRLQSPFWSPGQSGSNSLADRKKRLDDLFSSFDLETQRELRAGLRFGEELARRQREAESERQNMETIRSSSSRYDDRDEMEQEPIYPKLPMSDFETENESPVREGDDFHSGEHVRPATPNSRNADPQDREIPSRMSDREAEWQREREAISREIRMANSSQVIVIDSDDDDADDMNVEQEQPQNADEPPEDYGEDPLDDDDDYEDIWQMEARDPDPLGESTSYIYEDEREVSKPTRSEIPSPWKRGEDVDYSQDVETAPSLLWGSRSQRGESVLSNVDTQMKKLREQEIDISALIKKQAAQSRSFYEDDDKHDSPKKHSPNVPAEGSKQRATSRNYQTGSSPFRYSKTEAHYQNQQSPSPEKSPPISRERAHSISSESDVLSPPQVNDYLDDDQELSHNSSAEDAHNPHESRMDESPDPPAPDPPAPDPPAPDTGTTSTWFRSRLTSLTPNWLKSPAVEKSKTQSSLPEGSPEPPAPQSSSDHHSDLIHQPQQTSPIHHHSPPAKKPERKPHSRRRKSPVRKALATGGYFTNDHYSLLRRLYRQAKAFPELFPYNPTPARSAILGKWMWSADGLHGRPITEIQLAIVDRFVQELIHNSTRDGSEIEDHQLGWSEEELVRRLFSIVVGEKVRRERKLREAQANERRTSRRRHVEMEQ